MQISYADSLKGKITLLPLRKFGIPVLKLVRTIERIARVDQLLRAYCEYHTVVWSIMYITLHYTGWAKKTAHGVYGNPIQSNPIFIVKTQLTERN